MCFDNNVAAFPLMQDYISPMGVNEYLYQPFIVCVCNAYIW